MKLRSSLMIAFAATALLTGTAFAHDPALTARKMKPRPSPPPANNSTTRNTTKST
ncbi:hypothetical protein P4M26_33965 [Pseudomonas aeruginosa]|nr:hypothetical protein [Pseudomonas aeruginosa]